MDSYTTDTQHWLDKRFKMVDKEGIYHAHQPIYGFRKGHSEPGIIDRYVITYQILERLSHLEFSSLLDVGGAEGYKAAVIRKIFNVNVRSVDLSAEACERAKAIFDIDGEAVDIHHLPYKDNEFDVVLCSETLEHVPDLEKATRELLRVCSKAVIITVPHDSQEIIERNIREKIPHAHIHSLDVNSLDFLKPAGYKVISRKHHSSYLKRILRVADAMEIQSLNSYPQFLANIYNAFIPILRLIFNRISVNLLIKLDDYIANSSPSYLGMSFIVLKDGNCYLHNSRKKISARQVIDFEVPFHYL